MVSETDKAYIAGFVDGEGSFFIARAKWTPVISVVQKHLPVLEFIHKLYGGCFFKQSGNCWVLRISQSAQITRLCGDIWPYLREKKEQAGILMEVCVTTLKRSKNFYRMPPEILKQRKKAAVRLTELNHREVTNL